MADKTHGDIAINAHPAKIMHVIGDLELYPEWSEGVQLVEVSQMDAEGRPAVARFEFASGPIKDTFVLKYEWNGTDSVSWWLIEGGVLKKYDGTYTLTPNADGSVQVVYDLVVDLSIPMIGLIKKRAEKKIVKTALGGLKARVESLP